MGLSSPLRARRLAPAPWRFLALCSSLSARAVSARTPPRTGRPDRPSGRSTNGEGATIAASPLRRTRGRDQSAGSVRPPPHRAIAIGHAVTAFALPVLIAAGLDREAAQARLQ